MISDEMPTDELRNAYRRVEACQQRYNETKLQLRRCRSYEFPYQLIVSHEERDRRTREYLEADIALSDANRAYDRAERAYRAGLQAAQRA